MATRHLLLIALLCVASCAAPPPPAPVPAPAALPERAGFSETGAASWYGEDHEGLKTANGEHYNMRALTAAHRDLPFNTIARVTSVRTGRAVKVRINDRGPVAKDRIIDLSSAAAKALGVSDKGVLEVKIEVFASDQGPGS